jgi:hypothetical protein
MTYFHETFIYYNSFLICCFSFFTKYFSFMLKQHMDMSCISIYSKKKKKSSIFYYEWIIVFSLWRNGQTIFHNFQHKIKIGRMSFVFSFFFRVSFYQLSWLLCFILCFNNLCKMIQWSWFKLFSHRVTCHVQSSTEI